MLTREYLLQLFAYNQWANVRMLDAASLLTLQDLKRSHGHSWDSIHGTLVHMMAAEWIWLRRLQGQSPKAVLSPDEFPTIDAIRMRWSTVSGNIFAFIREQDERSLLEDVQYRNTKGQPFVLTAWKILVHVANHATHHRGELAAMFSAAGAAHEEDDWLYFFMQSSI